MQNVGSIQKVCKQSAIEVGHFEEVQPLFWLKLKKVCKKFGDFFVLL